MRRKGRVGSLNCHIQTVLNPKGLERKMREKRKREGF